MALATTIITTIFALTSILPGIVHVVLPDSGAGVIAGFDLHGDKGPITINMLSGR